MPVHSHTAPLTVSRKELIRNGSDADFRCMLNNLLAFSGRLERVRQCFGSSVGLSEIQYSLLMSILHLQGDRGVGVKSIAGHLSLSSPFVTNETGKLIRLGLVNKTPDPQDRRRVLLTLTEKADRMLSDLAPQQQEVNDALFARLNADDFDTLKRLSDSLVATAGEAVALVEYLTGRSGERK